MLRIRQFIIASVLLTGAQAASAQAPTLVRRSNESWERMRKFPRLGLISVKPRLTREGDLFKGSFDVKNDSDVGVKNIGIASMFYAPLAVGKIFAI
jgi:hypothetical protein